MLQSATSWQWITLFNFSELIAGLKIIGKKITLDSNPTNYVGDWTDIDTVLLDMDGTLLDLNFDNYFWLELVPQAYAAARAMHVGDAHVELKPRFDAVRGQLCWYCTDYWSKELALDIVDLKRTARQRIAWLRGAEDFLRALQREAKRIILVTNAHQNSLLLKHEQTGLGNYFHALVSAHNFGYPKEQPLFWQHLAREHIFDPARTLFIDDNLQVLQAAKNHGIRHVIAVTHPDSMLEKRTCVEFPSVERVAHLIDCDP